MKIIKDSKLAIRVSYGLAYDYVDREGCGFSFPCDENGNVKMDELGEVARQSLYYCQNDMVGGFQPSYVQKYVNRFIDPAVGLCDCGTGVVLSDFTNTCDQCGRDYNSSGQLLAPREQWGEETGEHPADIARYSWQ